MLKKIAWLCLVLILSTAWVKAQKKETVAKPETFATPPVFVSIPERKLSPKEVVRLEAVLKTKPDDFEARTRLIEHYEVGKILADEKSLQSHRVAIIRNNALEFSNDNQSLLRTYLGYWFTEDAKKPEYVELRNEWLKQIEQDKENDNIRSNAAAFIAHVELETAEKILRDGKAIHPSTLFSDQLIDIYEAEYHRQMIVQRSRYTDAEGINDSEASLKVILPKLAAEATFGLQVIEKEKDETWNDLYKPKFLASLAKAAFEIGETKKAGEAANDLLKILGDPKLIELGNNTEYFQIAMSIAGRAELKNGSLAKAKSYLLDSIPLANNENFASAKIDIKFIEEMFAKGGGEIVIEYLQLYKKLDLDEDSRAVINRWEAQIRQGKVPNFNDDSIAAPLY
jgi:hypothetical protein